VSTAVALGSAAAAALAYGIASVLQAAGARRGPGTLRTLRAPAYLCGVGLDLLAWALSVAALRTLPVYQVQAVLAGSVAVTVVAARVFLGARLRTVDQAAVAVTVVALCVLAAASGPQDPATPSAVTRTCLAVAVVPAALAGWAAARWASPAVTGAVTGAVAGLAFGGAALCARAATLPPRPWRDPAAVAAEPLVWALAAFGVTGTLLYAHALEHGEVGPVTALLWIVEVLVPSAVGVVLLGDGVRPGWGGAAAAAVAVTAAAAAVLAHAPAGAAGTARTAGAGSGEPR
jgi:drug/metabolite transporter (DMT)-like permease